MVYAHYDLVPSDYDFVDTAPGGWTTPAGKQFWDGQQGEVLCEDKGGKVMDWDWSPTPFWKRAQEGPHGEGGGRG